MWTPSLNFINLHYAYIIFMGILGLIVLYPYGNLRAIDAYFFGASASTESGLNTVDVKELKTYQQLYIYFIPIFTNLGFINILVVVVRLHWFEKRLKEAAIALRLPPKKHEDPEAAAARLAQSSSGPENGLHTGSKVENEPPEPLQRTTSISFADPPPRGEGAKALYIPSPRERDQGRGIEEVDYEGSDIVLERAQTSDSQSTVSGKIRQRRAVQQQRSTSMSIARVAESLFTLGPSTSHTRQETVARPPQEVQLSQQLALPELSSQATVGRNSQFRNLTAQDREMLGGIEYRAMKLLLKIVIAYFFGLQLFGVICLLPWIRHADPKYRDYLQECGQDSVWWAFYSAQTMVNNLGFTLTPDSMISFQDASWPMILMSFLAYAGNTFYPCLLRLIIWIMAKVCPKTSSLREVLEFLLNHPRRCYTLLFPSKPTWILFGILFVMNFVDIILIIVLDLHNPEVANLPGGPRLAAAIFQAASARHTGTSSFNLANVNPAVQFSLLVMMYIAIFPIAISIRASNTYESRALGIYHVDGEVNEADSKSYVLTHIRNQLTFDLWYIFLGIFCICIAESDRIMDPNEPAFAVFPIFFEVVSAYGNVGLSLGYPTVSTSLCGQFTTFSKLVICAMMIRGRHRGLPYQLDRAIVLPTDKSGTLSREEEMLEWSRSYPNLRKLKATYTT
ncbi:cation transport protein-domain-containing protein [Aspergillus granulosus]|uniref:Cation transport protein-domain-containing protein n=1 Tax=Aspergillus granulosus TaxID=176169 RepID=A0ABR4H7U3_9EURO